MEAAARGRTTGGAPSCRADALVPVERRGVHTPHLLHSQCLGGPQARAVVVGLGGALEHLQSVCSVGAHKDSAHSLGTTKRAHKACACSVSAASASTSSSDPVRLRITVSALRSSLFEAASALRASATTSNPAAAAAAEFGQPVEAGPKARSSGPPPPPPPLPLAMPMPPPPPSPAAPAAAAATLSP
jgi:hypothetical protein